jgi:hypothetical protein
LFVHFGRRKLEWKWFFFRLLLNLHLFRLLYNGMRNFLMNSFLRILILPLGWFFYSFRLTLNMLMLILFLLLLLILRSLNLHVLVDIWFMLFLLNLLFLLLIRLIFCLHILVILMKLRIFLVDELFSFDVINFLFFWQFAHRIWNKYVIIYIKSLLNFEYLVYW